jgi:hypothetical protein
MHLVSARILYIRKWERNNNRIPAYRDLALHLIIFSSSGFVSKRVETKDFCAVPSCYIKYGDLKCTYGDAFGIAYYLLLCVVIWHLGQVLLRIPHKFRETVERNPWEPSRNVSYSFETKVESARCYTRW